MGSKNKNTSHRSRIIDAFLARFKKVVNSTSDKVVESPMASIVNPAAAVVVPPTALRTALATTYLNGQNRLPAEPRPKPIDNGEFLGKRGPDDFIFGKLLGEGSFSTVYLSKDIHTQREFAIKVCMKHHIIREKKVEQVRREREILALLCHRQRETAPFFVKIFTSYQDTTRLFFVLTLAKRGELFSHISKVGTFNEKCAQFYSAELLHALEHMHSLGIVHRDLKPENILIDENMHIKITDFGSAKIMTENDENSESASRRNSFVGTAQYISPELLSDRGECSKASDMWAYGAIIYQMIAGVPPFRASSEYLIFRKIKNLEYETPEDVNPIAIDLVKRLLVIDPKQRLGAKDERPYTSIREHPLFEGIVFEELYKQKPPPIYAYVSPAEEEEFRAFFHIPDDLEPGLDDRQITRLLGLELQGCTPPKSSPSQSVEPVERRQRSLLGLSSLTSGEIEKRLVEQRKADPRWNSICEGNLILKKGYVHKRKGLFAKRRMLMLTTGPHLYYADPDTMTLKGEIPWTPELRVEPKNFKMFFVHTPNRTFYLQDPEGYALDWCKAIEEVRVHEYERKT